MECGRRSAVGGMLATGALAGFGIPWARATERPVRYLDPTGNDAADGMTPETAWRSLDSLAGLGPEGGVVLLRRRGIWRGTLRLAGAITLAAYGEGARPVILGSVSVSGIDRVGSAVGATLWQAPLSQEPFQVFLAGGRASRMTTKVDIVGAMQWHWADGRLTVAWSDNTPPPVDASVHHSGLELHDAAEAFVQSLDFRHAAYGIDADRAMSCVVDDCQFGGCYVSGIRASSAEGREELEIRGCRVEDSGGPGIVFGGRINRVLIDGNVVRRAGLLTERAVGSAGYEATFEWTAGIKNWGWGGEGWQGEVAITRNLVEACGPEAAPASPGQGIGIWLDEVVAPRRRHVVAWNRVGGCSSRGIYVEKCDRVDVDYNHIQDCAALEGTGSLALQANMYGYDVVADSPAMIPRGCRDNRLRHNTVIGGRVSLEAHARDPQCRMIGNLVEDNVMVSLDGDTVVGAHILISGGAANDGVNGHGNIYRGNGLGPRGGQRLEWNGRAAGNAATVTLWSTGAFWAIADADPQLVDAARGDIRLRATSPCRNAALGRPRDHDLAGRLVPRDDRADLGCLQYVRSETEVKKDGAGKAK